MTLAVADCELMHNVPGACLRCGDPPASGHLNWCSDRCLNWYLANHDWGTARRAALERDHHACVRCGHPDGYADGVVALVAWLTNSHPTGLRLWLENGDEATALAVIIRLTRFLHGHVQLVGHLDAAAALTAADPAVAEYLLWRHRVRLEVNHVVPRRGKGYAASCAHHLDGLETLCHQHHLEITAEQRAAARRERALAA